MFTVRVRVHGHVRELLPADKREVEVDLDGPLPVRGLLDRIGINTALVMAVVVNGDRVDKDFVLTGDADVDLLSPAAGG